MAAHLFQAVKEVDPSKVLQCKKMLTHLLQLTRCLISYK
jgi:hypothetical protein